MPVGTYAARGLRPSTALAKSSVPFEGGGLGDI